MFVKKVLTVALVGLACAHLALADEIVNKNTNDLLTVYGSRFSEMQSDSLPQTSIISADEIKNSAAVNVSEVLSKVGGLATRPNLDGSSNVSVDLRAYGDSADNNVVILLDGVRISENEQATARTSMIPVEIIDHIEVTKGGSSVLYGDGATSGAINIVTKKNAGDMTILSSGFSSYSGVQASIFHSAQLGPSQLSLFARGMSNNGYRDNSTINEKSTGLNWLTTVDSSLSFGFRLIGSQERDRLPGPLPMAYLNSAPTSTEVPGYQYNANTNMSSITVFASKKFDGAEFFIDLSNRYKTINTDWNYDAQNVYTGYQPAINFNTNTHSFGISGMQNTTQTASPRIRLTDIVSSGNDITIGYDWVQTVRGLNSYKTNSYAPDTMDSYLGEMKFKTQGIYIRDDWKITPNDRVTVGYRSQNYAQGNSNLLSNSYWNSFGSATANEIQYSRKFNSSLSGYLRVSQNFRLPNVDDNNSVNYDANWNPIYLLPQVSHDIDLGVSYKSRDWISEVKFFRSDITNEIGFDPSVNSGYGGNVNFDPTRRQGVDLRQYVKFAKQWDAKLNFQYVKANFVSGPYSGNSIPNTAQINGNLTFDYLIDSKQQLALINRFSGQKYASGDYLNNQQAVSGYIVNDLSYQYKEQKWSVIASINNIFNIQYSDIGIYRPYNSGDGYYYIPPYNLTVYPNSGRNFSVVGRYSF